MVGFSPIAPTIAVLFDVPILMVNVQALIFFMAYIPSNFASIFILNKYGLRTCLVIGSSLLLVGAWLRQLISFTDKFQVEFLGTVIAAFG